jgi:hypothetical protein
VTVYCNCASSVLVPIFGSAPDKLNYSLVVAANRNWRSGTVQSIMFASYYCDRFITQVYMFLTILVFNGRIQATQVCATEVQMNSSRSNARTYMCVFSLLSLFWKNRYCLHPVVWICNIYKISIHIPSTQLFIGMWTCFTLITICFGPKGHHQVLKQFSTRTNDILRSTS